MLRSAAIVAFCVLAAVAYGVVHDQVTARVCLEYFTIGHPPIVPPALPFESPTWQGLFWGVVATWWVGLPLGVALAIAARAGRRPKRSVRSLLRPIGTLLAVMAASALTMGLVGYGLGRAGAVVLVGPIAERVPADRHPAFLADLWAHSTSYAVGAIGGLVVAATVWRSRRPTGGDGGG